MKAGFVIRDSYGSHGALAERLAAEVMREGAPSPTGTLPGGWRTPDLQRAVAARHNGGTAPWIAGENALLLGTLLAGLGLLWLAISAGLLLRLGIAWRAVRRLTRVGTQKPDPRWAHALAVVRCRLDVGHAVTVRVSAFVDTPVLIGWWSPVVLIPRMTHAALCDSEIEAILAHELAHVRRGDYAINVLQSVVEALLFFHPVIWWLGARLRDEREFCSDDLAQRSISGSLGDYLRALLTLESLRTDPVPSPAVAANGGSLLRRIRRLMDMHRRIPKPRHEVDLALVLLGLLLLWSPSTGLTRTAHGASIAVMQHDLGLPRDFELIVREAAPGASGHLEERL